MKDIDKLIILILFICLVICVNYSVVEGYYEFAQFTERVKESWKLSVEAFLNQDYSLLFNLVFSKTES
jgi:hypothetical protein